MTKSTKANVAENRFVKRTRKLVAQAIHGGVDDTAVLIELLLQAAAVHAHRWRNKEDFLAWAGSLYDEALKHLREVHDQ